uniref:Carboxypeptidase B n=1 Tax=Sarcophilus harrisii TaxID=9305 RepID=A0A7N4PQ73_SARHA
MRLNYFLRVTLEGSSPSRFTPSHTRIAPGTIRYLQYFFCILTLFFQVDFWKPDSVSQIRPESTTDFRVKADQVDEVVHFLEENGLTYEVLIYDLNKLVSTQFDSLIRASGHSYEKYNSWEKIEAWTEKVAAENPELVSRSVIGTTFEGRSMYLLKAVRTYGTEIRMTDILDRLDFYILPVFNIDGYVYTWTKNRMWRKTRSTHAGSSCVGTDPNRNFDAGWCEIGASDNPCSDTYCGPTVESEKETQALVNFIRQNLNSIKAYVTVHSYSQMMLYPYSKSYTLIKNHVEMNNLAKAAIKELATLHGTQYTYGPGASTIYPAAGGSDDWAYDQGIKYAFTFELRDKGRYGFLLPESQIRPTCEETMLAIKHISNYVLEHLY